MLNSEDIAQLKIQALIDRQRSQNNANHYVDLTKILMSTSNNFHHFFIKHTPNSNIIGFCYILFCQACENRRDSFGVGHQSNMSPSEYSSSGSGSVTYDRRGGHRGKDQYSDTRAQKIYSLLLSQQINLSKITNLPQNIRKILSQISVEVNLYLKKLIIQLLSIIQNKCQQKKKLFSLSTQSSPKIQTILSVLQTYPIGQILLCIFMRSILYSQYEVTQALDFMNPISDHTVYAALCDAFNFTSLRMEQNYTEISPSYYIRALKIKPLTKDGSIQNTYLVSIPQSKQNFSSSKQFLGDSFRVQRKSSGQTSNNQSVSFRQSCKTLSNQQSKQQGMNKIQHQSFDIKEEKQQQVKEIIKFGSDSSLFKRDIQQNINNTQQKKQLRRSYNSQKQIKNAQAYINKQQKIQNNPEYENPSKFEPESDGYTSVYILKQLHPSVRQVILTKIDHYRKTRHL